jgi:hypothetical protein
VVELSGRVQALAAVLDQKASAALRLELPNCGGNSTLFCDAIGNVRWESRTERAVPDAQ